MEGGQPQERLAHVVGAKDVPLVDSTVHDYWLNLAPPNPKGIPLLRFVEVVEEDEETRSENIKRNDGALQRGKEESKRMKVIKSYDKESLLYDVRLFASILQKKLNMTEGDYVAIALPTGPEFAVAYLAVLMAGGICVVLNPTFSLEEMNSLASFVDCSVLILCESFKEKDHFASIPLHFNKDTKTKVKRLVVVTDKDVSTLYNTSKWSELMKVDEETSVAPLPATTRTSQDVATVLYTSGSTASPKAVELSHFNLLNSALATARRLHLNREEHIVCSSFPLFFAGGLTLGLLMLAITGVPCVAPPPLFDPLVAMEICHATRSTHFFAAPSQLNAIFNHPRLLEFDLSQLKYGLTAGAVCPSSLMERICFFVPGMVQCFGMTETGGGVFIHDPIPQATQTQLTTCGTIIDHMEARVVDQKGKVLRRGEVGQLQTRGFATMLGYMHAPDKTAETIHPTERWLTTGDMAQILPSGHCKIVGRYKEMINKGGEKVYPSELETFLNQHPIVKEVAVIGVPDEDMGEEVCACIVLKETKKPFTGKDVRAFCRKGRGLARMIPRHVIFLDKELPKTPSGKIHKGTLLEIFNQKQNKQLDTNRLDEKPEEKAKAREESNEGDEVERKVLQIGREILGGEEALMPEDNFYDVGFSSLQLVRMGMKLQETFNVALDEKDLFHLMSVVAVANAIKRHMTGEGKKDKEEKDKALLEKLKRDCILDEDIRYTDIQEKQNHEKEQKEDAILVTGAAGFLGIHLFSHLLAQHNKHNNTTKVVCVVRASDDIDALNTIKKRMIEYKLLEPSEWQRVLSTSQIEAYAGDISKPRLGLKESVYINLAERVSTVYHCAAKVNWLLSYEQVYSANVLGTKEVLRFCFSGKKKSLCHISTIGVLESHTDWTNPTAIASIKEDAPLSPHLDNLISVSGYNQSKFVAEALVHDAQRRGLPVIIFRPGYITGSSKNGVWFPSDFLPRLFRGCLQLGLVPDWSSNGHAVDILPVDFVAEAIIAITHNSLNNREMETHAESPSPLLVATMANLNAVPLSTALDAFLSLFEENKACKKRHKVVSHEEWIAAVNADIKANLKDNPLIELLPMLSVNQQVAYKFSTAQADGSNFKRLLHASNNNKKEEAVVVPSADTLLPIYVDWMKGAFAQPNSSFIPHRS